MKNRASYIRFIILALIIFMVQNSAVYPQGTDTRRKAGGKQKTLYVGILLSPVQTSISNEGSSDFSTLSSTKGNSMNFSLDAGYFFSGMIGISSGLTFGSYASKFSLDSYTDKYSTVDSESEAYEMQINGKSISEDQKISYLGIPVCINFRFQANGKLGFYLKAGAGFEIPITKTYNGNGTFTYDGYYAVYPVTLKNLAEYGFPSNLNTDASGTLQIKSLNPAIIASGGVLFSLNEKIQLVLGACFNKSLSNISAYKPDEEYKITSKANELNSIMGGSTKVGAQAFGLNIGVRYFLK